MEFAGVKLIIEQEVVGEIEKNVYTYLQNEKFLKILLDRTDTYFPIISKILTEEKVPDDFKYLAVMESKLIADAVSSSGAEGFWQIKKETATQLGIEAGLEVDERRNIISSTHAASQYLKKSNETFNNWIYALLSYNLGLQGAVSVADYKFYSSNKMVINSKTHWYIIKAISCKIALQRRVGLHTEPRVILFEYKAVKGQTLQEIALNNQVDADSVFAYNKWLKTFKIPGGKPYIVFIPLVSVPGENSPVPRELYANNPNPVILSKNGLNAIQAKIGDTYEKLATDGKIPIEKLKEYNEIGPLNPMYHGQICYLEKKHKKPHPYLPRFHIVKHGENLWRISQNFGVESSLIRKFNKLKEGNDIALAEEPRTGQKLWLKETRPDSVGIEMLVNVRENRFDELSEEETLDTTALSVSENEAVMDTPLDSKPETVKEKIYIYSLDSKPDSFPSVDSAINNYSLANKTETPPQPEEKEKAAEIISNKPSVENPKTPPKPTIAKEEKLKNKTLKPTPDRVTYHEWKKGESLYDIASKYKCTIKQILLWNNLSANAKEVGMKLLIRDPKENMGAKPVYHKVMKGETLWRISVLYQSTLNQLTSWNNLTNYNLSVGQMLRVSGGQEKDIATLNTEWANEEDKSKTGNSEFHIVVAGENLFRISQKYGATVDELKSINQLPNHHLFVGQMVKLKREEGRGKREVGIQQLVKGNKPSPVGANLATVPQQQGNNDKKFHIVETGETLFGISKKYNVTVDKIKGWNNITGNQIAVGEQLIVGEISAVVNRQSAVGSRQSAVDNRKSEVGSQQDANQQTSSSEKMAGKPVEHTVAPGENLMTIAKKYSVTPLNLKTWNNLKTMVVVKGQVLKVSDPSKVSLPVAIGDAGIINPSVVPVKHTVKPGEVLPVIAKKYKVTPEQIKTWNNLKTSAIKPGQILLVNNPEIIEKKTMPESPAISFSNIQNPPEKTNYTLPDTTNYLPNPGMKITLYSVKEGETIFQIANKYNTTVSEIMRINRLSSYSIEPGQRLTIAFADQTKFDLINHTVSQGETLYSIARQYNCKVSEILDWNEKTEMSIQIGEALKIRRVK